MSNRKSGEIPDRRKLKVSLAMNISQGLGGPKLATCLSRRLAMDKRLIFRSLNTFSTEGRSLVVWAAYWIAVLGLRMSVRQIRQAQVQELRKDFSSD